MAQDCRDRSVKFMCSEHSHALPAESELLGPFPGQIPTSFSLPTECVSLRDDVGTGLCTLEAFAHISLQLTIPRRFLVSALQTISSF